MAKAKQEAVAGTASTEETRNIIVSGGTNYYTDAYFSGLADRVRVAQRVELAKQVQEKWDSEWSGAGLSDDELMKVVVEFVRGGESK